MRRHASGRGTCRREPPGCPRTPCCAGEGGGQRGGYEQAVELEIAGVGTGAYWEGSTGQGTRRREAEEESGGWFPQYLRCRGVVTG